MARAETLESGGGGAEAERGGPGPLVQPMSCRMEVPMPGLGTWSGMLTTTSLHQSQDHPLHTPEVLLRPRTPLPPCTRRDEEVEEERLRTEPRVCSVEPPAEDRTGSGSEERQEASREQGPPPDMQPQDEHPSRASARCGLPGEVEVEEEDIRRVAHQLRAIGDQINTTVLHRAQHAAPQWRDLRNACLQLINFVSQTFNTLYRRM